MMLAASIVVGLLCIVALVVAAVKDFQRNDAELRAESERHWQQVAADILAKDPNADVSWCFSPGRPPRRNPTTPPTTGASA